MVNDTDINGLAASVSQVLTSKGFATGTVGNNDGGHVKASQVRAAKGDDLGAQQISKGWVACRWSRTPRWHRDRSGWCWPTTTPARAPGFPTAAW